jgi:outer membrane receptor protein involved in Fe transport
LALVADRILVSAAGFADYEANWNGSQIDIVLRPALISEQITVTGTESRLGDTPASVVVLKREELNTNPAATLDDKLRQVPGFTLFRRSGGRTANPTSQGVSIRGTGGSGASRAAILVNDVPLNDPFGGWVYWGRIPGKSIDQVEVLRGSASDLLGSSAIGGVVSVTTRRTAKRPVLDLEASYGSQETPLVSLFAATSRHKWNVSLASETFATDGFITVAEGQRRLVDMPAGSNRFGVNPFLEYVITKNWRMFAGAEYFEERRENGTPLQTNDTKILSGRLGTDLGSDKFGELTVRGWLLSEVYHQSFSSIAADRNSESLTRLQTVPSQSGGAKIQWSKVYSSRGTIFAGAESRIVIGSSNETAFAGGRATSLIGAGGRELTFGELIGGTFSPIQRLVLSGGVRLDHWREYSAYSATRSLTGTSFTRTSFNDRTENAVNPRASLLFRFRDGISLTGAFSTGFRQPTLNELYRSFRVGNVLTVANENLRAERAKTGEAGILVSGFGNRVYARAVTFCTEIKQPVSNVTLSTTLSLITRQRQNLGSTRSCGIEADSQFRVRNDLYLSAGYLFVDARVKSFPADRSLENLRVPQVAKNQFTFQARYSNPKIATFNIQLRAVDSQFDDDQNLFRLKGFATVDFFASRHINQSLEIFAAIENIFNTTIEAGRTPTLSITGPRTVRGGIRLHLGKNGQ